MSSSKKLTLEELSVLVFEQGQATKQNKDRLFKLAKAEKDIQCIKKLRDNFDFKSAKIYIIKLNTISIKEVLKTRDIDMLKVLIGKESDFSHINLTELIVKKYHNEFIKLLIENGANVNQIGEGGHTVLMMASFLENIELIEFLMKYNVNINAKAEYGDTALILSSHNKNKKIVEILIENEADLNIVNNSKNSALMTAINSQNTEISRQLIQSNSDVNLQDEHGYTALIIAVQNECVDTIQQLVEKEANLDIQDDKGFTALMSSFSVTTNEDIISILVNSGANLNLQNHLGITALMFATKIENLSIVKLLLDNNADANIKDNILKGTALMAACTMKNEELALTLLKHTIDLNIQSKDGNAALLDAVNNNMLNVTKTLLENEADINIQNNTNGITPLMIACTNENEKMVNLLLKYNPDLKLLDHFRRSTTEYAAYSVNYNIIKLLLSKGANKIKVSAFDNDGALDNETFDKRAKFVQKIPLLANKVKKLLTSKKIAEQFIIFEFNMMKTIGLLDTFIEKNKIYLDKIRVNTLNEDIRLIQASSDMFLNILTSVEVEAKAYTMERILDIIMQDYSIGMYSNNIYDEIKYDKYHNNYKYKLVLENQFDGKAYIDVYDYKLVFHFLNKYNERSSFEFKMISYNKFYDERRGYILIFDNFLIEKTPNGNQRISKFIIRDEFDGIVSHTNHNPKSLVRLLTNFTLDTPIKYTTHEWRKRVEKKYINNFDLFINDVTNQLYIIKDDLNKLSSNLFQKIYAFVTSEEPSQESWCRQGNIRIGWSSLKGLRKWVNNGNEPWDFPLESQIDINGITISRFGEVIKLFKAEIETTENILQDMFLAQKTRLGRKFKINISNNLVGEKIYTDVSKLQDAIIEIFKEIEKYAYISNLYEVEVELHKPENSSSKYIELHIIHINSESTRDADALLKRVKEKGDVVEIFKLLTNLCDWEIKANYKQIPFKIDCFDGNDITSEDKSKVQGYTHIMRFYK